VHPHSITHVAHEEHNSSSIVVCLLFRAKTNKALLPAKSEIPAVALIGSDFITFRVILPAPGGSPIVRCSVEAMSLEDDSSFVTAYSLNQSVSETEIQCRVSNLIAGNAYIFRCGAESLVGKGPNSDWTDHIKLPPPAATAAATQ